MSTGPIENVLHHIRGLVVAQDIAGLPDGVLLDRFLTRRDESAFEALVRRHGPMVLGVCRRVLRDAQDAEDAFQATFLVFVRRAAAIARRELLGNWLYGVAHHTARAARAAAGRRRAKEAKAVPRQPSVDPPTLAELRPLVDQELSRLPAKYRIPVILCDLQEKSRQDAARELGLLEGTLSSRLARARAILAGRLARRGMTLTTAALAAGLARETSAAALPPSLVQATVTAGTLVMAGQSATTALVSANVAPLAKGVLRAMFFAKVKMVAATALAGSLLVLCVGAVVSRTGSAQPVIEAPANVDREANPLLQQALEAARTIADLHARFDALEAVAMAQIESGDRPAGLKTAQEALDLSKAFGASPATVQAMARVAYVRISAADVEAARQALKEGEQAVRAIDNAHDQRNARLFLLRAQVFAGDYDACLRTVKDSGDLQVIALERFARGLEQAFRNKKLNKPEARKALKQALTLVKFDGNRPVGEKIQVLSSVARAQVLAGDMDGASATVGELDAWQFIGKVAMVRAQVNTGDFAGALKTGDAMWENQPKAEALSAIARAQVKAEERDAGRITLQRARKVADLAHLQGVAQQEVPGRMVQRSSLAVLSGEIALTQYLLGDTEAALKTVLTIEPDLEKARAFLDIGAAQVEAGKKVEARGTLLSATRAALDAAAVARNVRNPIPDGRSGGSAIAAVAATLRQIAVAQAQAGDIPEALRTVASIPTQREQEPALAEIAPVQARAGDRKAALETLGRIQGMIDKASALEKIVEAEARSGHEQEALTLALQQESPALKVRALLGVARAKLKEKAPEKD